MQANNKLTHLSKLKA